MLVPWCYCTEPFLYHEKFTGSHSTVTNRAPRTAPSGEGARKEVIKRIAEKRLKRERKVNHLFGVPSSTDLFRSLSVHYH